MSEKNEPVTEMAGKYRRARAENKARYIRYREGSEIYGVSQSTFEKMAREAGAIYKVGKMALIKVDILEAYLEQFHINP